MTIDPSIIITDADVIGVLVADRVQALIEQKPEAVLGEEEAARRRPLIPERIGLDEPYSAEARDEIDRELGISDYLSTPPVRADKELVTNG